MLIYSVYPVDYYSITISFLVAGYLMAMWNMLTIYLFINLRRHMQRYDSVPFKFVMNSLGEINCVPIIGYRVNCHNVAYPIFVI